jgi:hypothetical protein
MYEGNEVVAMVVRTGPTDPLMGEIQGAVVALGIAVLLIGAMWLVMALVKLRRLRPLETETAREPGTCPHSEEVCCKPCPPHGPSDHHVDESLG